MHRRVDQAEKFVSVLQEYSFAERHCAERACSTVIIIQIELKINSL
jgi:hypothetical protein